MIGAIIGALGSTLAAGISSASQTKQARLAEQEQAKKEAFRDQMYARHSNEDVTQLASVQAMLNQGRELYRENIEAAKGRAAVMGGGSQEVAAAQEAGSKMMGGVLRDAAAMGTARKDALDENYEAGKLGSFDTRTDTYNQRNAQIGAAGSSAIQAGLSMVGADAQSHLNNSKGMFETMYQDMFKKK